MNCVPESVCIGDEVLLTNGLFGTIEFIGSIHDFNNVDLISFQRDDDNENDEEKEKKIDRIEFAAYYGVVINLENHIKYPLCLDIDRGSKYGLINNVQRIPKQLFFNDYIESVFVARNQIKYVHRKKHNFRLSMDDTFVIPFDFDALCIYLGCKAILKYAGYLCSHKRKTNDDIETDKYNDYIQHNGVLQNYYLGFMIDESHKELVKFNNLDKKVKNYRLYRLYPNDSRRYIYHHFNNDLDAMKPLPNDDIVLFMNLQYIITRLNPLNDTISECNIYFYRKMMATYFNAMKAQYIDKSIPITFNLFLESVILRYWKCVKYLIIDISNMIEDYLPFYCKESVLITSCSKICDLYQCKFVDKALDYGFDKVCIIDNHTLKEIIYKDEESLLCPWIEGHLFDTKLWIKTQFHKKDNYRAVIPAFRTKTQCTNTNIDSVDARNDDIKWKKGLKHGTVVIVYKFKTVTMIMLWKEYNNDDQGKHRLRFHEIIRSVKLKKVSTKQNKIKTKKLFESQLKTKISSKSINDDEEKQKKTQNQWLPKDEAPLKRYQVMTNTLHHIFNPMEQYFNNKL